MVLLFSSFFQAQFFSILVYTVQSLVVECEFPRWMQWCALAYGLSMIILFLNFYFHAYIKNKSTVGAYTCIFFLYFHVHILFSVHECR